MNHQLLATFYIESPCALYTDVAITARIQYPTNQAGTNWSTDWQLRCGDEDGNTVTTAHYTDENGTRRRYKIDVYRRAEYDDYFSVYRYPLGKAGTYPRRLQVLHNGNVVLERMIYITVQPEVQVFAEVNGQRVDLIRTVPTVVSQNPLVRTMEIQKGDSATAASTIALVQSNNYKHALFVKSNVLIDLVSNDLTDNHTGSDYTERWVQMKDSITVTRKIGNTPYPWRGEYDYS